MAGKMTKMTIWALDASLRIEDLPAILEMDYTREIDYLSERQGLSRTDKRLLHRWLGYNDQGFEVTEDEIAGLTIKYISAIASFESTAPQEEAIIGDFILPREKRVTRNELPVFFFEHFGRVYSIVIGSEYKTRFVRSLLMATGRVQNEELREKWKKVQFKDIPNFTFSSDFFYWLISKQNSNVETTFIPINVSDIRYLSQSADRRDTRHESEGDNILDEAISKTGLGVNSRVGQVGTTLEIESGTIRFNLFENGDCFIDNYLSVINGPQGELDPFEVHLDKGAILLYAVLLPALSEAFNSDRTSGNWTIQHQADSRKIWALGAINELCSENAVSIEEIKDLEWFKSNS